MAVARGDPLPRHHHRLLASRPPVLTSASGQPAPAPCSSPRPAVAGSRLRPSALEVSALNQHGGAGLGGQPLALRQGLRPVGRDRLLEQHGKFGKIRRDQVRQRQEGPQGGLGRFLQEPVTAGGDHHRVQDHDGGTHLFQPAADGVDHRASPSMPILTASMPMSSLTASSCAVRNAAGGTWTARTPLGVLRRQGGDGGHAVAAVRRDALQVGLDPGPAGRVRAGDGQHAGNARRRGRGGPAAPGRKSRGRNSDGLTADKADIPSPVLTGQVQRVWISAGPMRGTPCQCSSLAVAPGAPLTRRVRAGADVLLRPLRPGPAARPSR